MIRCETRELGRNKVRTPCQKNRPSQPNTGRSTVASAPRANVHDFCSQVLATTYTNWCTIRMHLAIIWDCRIAMLEIREHDDPVMRPLACAEVFQ